MEYTGIGKEKEEFVPRKSREELYRDGEVIRELYQLMIRCSPFRGSDILEVFNHAYFICKVHLFQLSFCEKFKEEDLSKKRYSYAIACVLLDLHRKFYPVSEESVASLKSKTNPSVWMRFSKVAHDNELKAPIFFKSETKLKEEVDFTKVKDYVMTALDKAIRLEDENKRLRNLWEREKLKREEAECIIKSQQLKLDIWESNAFYKAVNINSIVEYVQKDGLEKTDVSTIKLMLLDLCANKVPNEVIEKIKNLKGGGNVTIGNQTNNNCQQFFGNISDSEFPK